MKQVCKARYLYKRIIICMLVLCMVALMFTGLNMTAEAASYSSISADTALFGGDTLSGTVSNCTVTIPSGATVTVTGQITITGTVNLVGGGKLVRGNSFTSASMIKVSSGATLNIGTSGATGVTIDGNSTTMTFNGGGIYVDGGTLNLRSGTTLADHYISKSDGMGGGIYVNSGILNMYDGVLIKDNKSTVTSANGGGGIAVNEGATFNMYGGTISGNSAPCTAGGTGGAGIYTKGTFNMYDGTISGNTSGRNGGAVHIDGGTNTTGSPVMTMTGGLITGNSAMFGGGIEILAKATLNISAGKINSNTCTTAGGGIELDASGYSGLLKISGSAEVTGNSKNGAQNNILIDKNITVVGNFTGSVGIMHESASYNAAGQTFGTASGSYTGLESFFCDNKALVGTLSGTNVIWRASTTALTGVALSTNSPVTGTEITSTLNPSGASATYQWYRNTGNSNSGGTIIVGATGSSYTPTSADAGKHLYVVANGTGGCTGIVTSAATTSAVQYSTTVSTPVFSVAAGTYISSKSVEISCATGGADIYYTTNGAAPTSGSTKYTGAITVATTTTVKAIAVKEECADSAVASATYTISVITATPYTGPYDGAAHNAVTLTGTQVGDTITYSEDGTAYTENCPQYSNPGSYSVYVKVSRTGCGEWASGKKTVTIGRATGSVTITGDPSKAYDGSAVSDPAVTKNGSGAVTYAYYRDSSGSMGAVLPGAPINAGAYWVQAAVAQCDTYTAATASRKFTISPSSIDTDAEAKLLLSYSLDSVTYNGSPQPISVTAASGVEGLGGITVYYEGTGGTAYTKSSTAPTNVGTYTVSVNIAEGSNYGSYTGLELGNYTINKTAITGVTASGYSEVYDGEEHSIMLSGIPAGATVVYRVGGSGEYNLASLPVFKDAGIYTVCYKISKSDYNDLTGSAQVEIAKRELDASMVENISGTFTYNGTAQTPVPTVVDGTPSIITSSDYTVSYSDNIDPGTATATITALADGNYVGAVSKTFTINRKTLTAAMIADIAALTYNGAVQEPTLTISDGTPGIITASDYTVSYSNNTYPGTATVTVTALAAGHYMGSASKTFVINPKTLTPDMIGEIAALTYNGKAQSPELTVTDGTPGIITASDYTVSYANNTEAGTATASITATANGNYTGMASVPFTIRQKPLNASMLSDLESAVYNGYAQMPTFTVTDGTPSIIGPADYTYAYTDNTNAGTASLIVTATEKGNYSGTAVKTFTISKKALTSSMVAAIDDLVYIGAALKPTLAVRDGAPSIINASDYAISYSDNTDAGIATVTVTARITGNYYGSATKEFTIHTAAIAGVVSVPASAKNGVRIEADISGVSPSGARSELTYQWKRDGAAITGATAASYTVADEDVGKTLTVMATGTGNYSGSIVSAGVAVEAKVVSSPITMAAPVFDGETVTIGGSVTLTGQTYTASIGIKTLADNTWKVVDSGTYSSGNTFGVDLSDLKPGTVYVYRITVVIAGQTYTATGRFLTPSASSSTAPAGSIAGSVNDNSGLSAAISVTIERGNTAIASRTGLKNGSTFTFTALPDGIYNVVANNGSYRVTKIITVKNGEAVDGVKMTIEKKQSVVTVGTDDTPDVAVGGLDELFQYESMYTTADAKIVASGGTVEIKLIAEKQKEDSLNAADKDKLNDAAGSAQIAMYLDLSVIKTVYDGDGKANEQTRLSELSGLIEVAIPIPEDLQGKAGLTIYRMHNDIAESIPEGVQNANSDGEYCVIENGYITLYVKNFCTYAIGYADEVKTQGCVIHWWLLAVLVALIATGTVITRRNAKRIRDGKGGIEI